MKIHVLTYGHPDKLSHVSKFDLGLLQEAAKKQGHKVEMVFARDCQLVFDKKPKVLVNNKFPKNIKVLLVRANCLKNLEFRTALIKQFQLSGVNVINDHISVLRAKNKLRTMQVLGKYKVPTPKTFMVVSSDAIEDLISNIEKFPVIIKTTTGSHGSGVSIVESERGLRTIAPILMNNEDVEPIMVQEYVKESKGKDIRVFIVGNRIVAAMERIATKRGEFRSNFHLGGRVRVAEMSRKEKDVAFAAARAVGLDIAGVDIIRTSSGPKVLEVNANPGLEGITQATGRDVAGEMIKYAVESVKKK